MKKNCLVCNKEFKVCFSDIKRGRDKYCSRRCYYDSRIGAAPSEKTRKKISEANKGEKAYRWKGGKISLHCLICKEEFKVKLCKKNTAKFCSKKCHGKWDSINLVGEKSKGWKGGLTALNDLIRHTVQYREWAKTVKKRDDFTCQICGERGGMLRSNHIKKFSDYPELRMVLLNGITIHKDCDIKFVLHREKEWEDYFKLNLKNRGFIELTQ